jgi:dipeptidyl aminopeptidase/acylaminoacyl peptidase
MRRLIPAAACCLLLSEGVWGEEPAVIDYATQIAPIFATYCNGCHNADDAEGKLVLEQYATLLMGSENGPVITPGNIEASRLIAVLTAEDDSRMPPEDNEPPTAGEIDLLGQWIAAGAAGPEGEAPAPTLPPLPDIQPRRAVAQPVGAAAYSPSGETLAVAGFGEVRIVSAANRATLTTLGGLWGNVTSLEFADEGRLLVAGGGEPGLFGEVVVWDTGAWSEVRRVRGHRDSLYAARVSPDGKLLATAGYDRDIIVWDFATGEPLRTLSGHSGAVFDLAFHPGGRMLASASADRTAKLWDVTSGARLDTFGQALKELYSLAFSPDGHALVTGGVDNRIRVYEISESGTEGTSPLKLSRFAHEGAIVRLVYSADGKTLASSAEDRTVKVWDTAETIERRLLEPQSDVAPALVFSPDGKQLAVGRLDGGLVVYNSESGAAVPPAKPELTTVWPAGISPGATVRLHLGGKNLVDVSALELSNDKLTARVFVASDAEGSDAQGATDADALMIEVTAAADLPLGTHELSVVAAGGSSNKLQIYADDLPQLSEREPNDREPSQAAAGQFDSPSLPSGVWGRFDGRGDIDHYAFEGKAGETVVFDLAARSVGSKADCVLTVLDENGRLVASQNNFDGGEDPLLAFKVPADGRYAVRVSELYFNGSPEHYYRLSMGTFPLVTACYPLSVPAAATTSVRLVGYNLPDGAAVDVTAKDAGKFALAIDRSQYRIRRGLSVTIGDGPESVETEPNNAPAEATAITTPTTVGGRISAVSADVAGDVDLFRCQFKQGEKWVIATDAAELGSPIDTKIDVLDAEGRPVPRVLLQATRDSYLTFRSIDSVTTDARVGNWEEMELNEYMYMGSEVCRIFRMPRGPDSGFQFYGVGGKRRCYFDTSATAHAVDDPFYIVTPLQSETELVPNGLPVFTINYTNDDDGWRSGGRDSRLIFAAPADGEYLVRVSDVRGHQGDRYAYRLVVRRPRPDFAISVGGDNPAVPRGSGRTVTFSANRLDDFEGDIEVSVTGMPAGFTIASPVVIEAGHGEAETVVYAAEDAESPTAEALKNIKIIARATVGDAAVEKVVKALGNLKAAEPAKFRVWLEPPEVTIEPGKTVTAKIRIERNGHEGRVRFEVRNLPHGVIVDNIGLSGVLVREGETEREIFFAARDWVPETTRLTHAESVEPASEASPPISLNVREPATVAKAE